MSNLTLINNTLYNKAERIAAALYLVSNMMPEGEILKTKIRSLSLELVSLCISLKDNTEINNQLLLKNLEKKILELVSLLNITSVSGLISEMNAGILKKEFDIFLRSVSDLTQSVEMSKFAVSKEFFDNLENQPELLKRSVSEFDNPAPRSLLPDKVGRRNQRNKDILNLISKKRNVSIKDIALSVKGCSEKTIQRELNSLIKEGIVKKAGERRWSRYSLA